MVGVKVFVGNLSFKTTEAELMEAFKASGKIVNAHIITTPSNRSKGYGFVEFENKADAEAAVAAMNKKEVGGRPINVELARPQEETTTTKKEEGSKPSAPESDETRKKRVPRKRNINKDETTTTTTTRAPREPREHREPREPREPREHKKETNNNSGKTEVVDSDAAPKRRPRRYQEKRTQVDAPEADKTPSKTMIFVANLAWKVTDESFTEFLKAEGIKFKSANVVVTKSGRSRGYGFVNCENSEEQARALEILNKKELDSRPLNAKVANASSETPRTPATTTTTPATTQPVETK